MARFANFFSLPPLSRHTCIGSSAHQCHLQEREASRTSREGKQQAKSSMRFSNGGDSCHLTSSTLPWTAYRSEKSMHAEAQARPSYLTSNSTSDGRQPRSGKVTSVFTAEAPTVLFDWQPLPLRDPLLARVSSSYLCAAAHHDVREECACHAQPGSFPNPTLLTVDCP